MHRTNIGANQVPPGALVSFLQRGIQYVEMQSNLNEVCLWGFPYLISRLVHQKYSQLQPVCIDYMPEHSERASPTTRSSLVIWQPINDHSPYKSHKLCLNGSRASPGRIQSLHLEGGPVCGLGVACAPQEASGIDGDYTMLSAREIITKPVEDLKRSVHLKKEENAEKQRSHPQSRYVVCTQVHNGPRSTCLPSSVKVEELNCKLAQSGCYTAPGSSSRKGSFPSSSQCA